MARRKRKHGFIRFINLFGTIILLIMLVIVAYNFSRDARILKEPILTAIESTAEK